MKEAKFVLPLGALAVSEVEARSLHGKLAGALVCQFGGFTRVQAEGFWLDLEGGVVREGVYVYTVALERGQAEELHGLAMEYAGKLNQRFLYFKWPHTDEVEISEVR